MKPIILFTITLLSIATGLNAQLLWRISGNGLESPSYLLGSHHIAPISIKDSIAGLQTAFQQCSQVYGEVAIEEFTSQETMSKLKQMMTLPGDTTLHDLYTPVAYDSLANLIKNNFGIDLSMLDKLTPQTISNQLTVLIAAQSVGGFDPEKQLDMYFQQQAQLQGMQTGGLESIDTQLNLLYQEQSLTRQAELLYCIVTNMEYTIRQIQIMTAAYMDQDLDRLQAVMEESDDVCPTTPDEESAFISNRNKNWMEKIPHIMMQAPTFFIVGAGHLPGSDGLLELLEKQGYKVEPYNK